MTEEIVATPGWVDEKLDELFGPLSDTPAIAAARTTYAACLATRKAPATPSDMLGAEFEPCRPALHRALQQAGVTATALAELETSLEALEAEIAADS